MKGTEGGLRVRPSDRNARYKEGKDDMELPTVARVSVGSTTRKVAPAKIGKAKFTSNGIRNGTIAGTRNKSVTLGHHANRTVAVAAGDVDASQGQQDSKQVRSSDPMDVAQCPDGAIPSFEVRSC